MRSNIVPYCCLFSPSGASLLLKVNFPDGGYLLVHFATALHSHQEPYTNDVIALVRGEGGWPKNDKKEGGLRDLYSKKHDKGENFI